MLARIYHIYVANLVVPVLHNLCSLTDSEMLLEMQRNAFYDEFHAALKRCAIDDRTPTSAAATPQPQSFPLATPPLDVVNTLK